VTSGAGIATGAVAKGWRPRLVAAGPPVLALALALFAQGTRGLGEPDEGRNVQIAQAMLASGDWLLPRLHGLAYLDKPPLTFWLTAASLRWLGATEFAARAPLALAHLVATAAVVWLGSMLWGNGVGRRSGWVYALSLAPFVGAGVLTPDAYLAAAAALTAACFWRATSRGGAAFWLAAGLAAGAGLLAKGAAMVVWALPLVLAETSRRRSLRWLLARGPWLGLVAATAVAAPWFVWAIRHLPGAAAYMLSNQITGRLVESGYDRNAQPSAVLSMYMPVLIAGALPWTGVLAIRVPSLWRQWRDGSRTRSTSEARFVQLDLLVPFAIFAVASSRLPLYLLPIFAPLALALARALPRPSPHRRGRGIAFALAALWIVALGGLKVAAARQLGKRDGHQLTAWVREGVGVPSMPVYAVDADLFSLPFYGVADVRWASTKRHPYPMYATPPRLDAALARDVPAAAVLVTPEQRVASVIEIAERGNLRCEPDSRRARLTRLACRSIADSTAARNIAGAPAASVDGGVAGATVQARPSSQSPETASSRPAIRGGVRVSRKTSNPIGSSAKATRVVAVTAVVESGQPPR